MSIEYRSESQKKCEQTIKKLLKNAPPYVESFYTHMKGGKREITTQMSYIRDSIDFLYYELRMTNSLNKGINLKDIPCETLEQLKPQDLAEYRDYLKNTCSLSNASVKKKLSSISAFFLFLHQNEYIATNPMYKLEMPAVNKKRIIKLNCEMSNKLLNGILKNDSFLVGDEETGFHVIEIDEATRVRREKLVLRNYAICCLFLGTGLRVSELVGLDLSDINFSNNSLTIVAKGGDEVSVFFGDDVASALHQYLDGTPLPLQLLGKYQNNQELLDWCKQYATNPNFVSKFTEDFKDKFQNYEEVLRDLLKIRQAVLRQGRSGLNKKLRNPAVFLSNRGTRMSVRSVELMIKEMVRTYLPEYDDKDKFSPHKLRATCASRILAQTGNINLARTQLNHKDISVTANFYAQMEQEKHKEIVRQLDINEW